MKSKLPDFGLPPINWFGVAASALMLLIPFLGVWWVGTIGTGAIEIGLSPFDMRMSVLDVPVQSDLIVFFLIAAKISFVIAGLFMLFSSIFPRKWWSKRLFNFGVMTPFSYVVFFILSLVIVSFAANTIVPSVLSSMSGEGGGFNIDIIIPPIVVIIVLFVSVYILYSIFGRLLSKISRETKKSQIKGNILRVSILIAMLVVGALMYPKIPPQPDGTNVNIPYVVGTAISWIQMMEMVTLSASVTLSLTGAFWLTVGAAILCIFARIYYGRFLALPEKELVIEEHKIVKLKPAEEKKKLKLRAK
jgi:hypothetical protein